MKSKKNILLITLVTLIVARVVVVIIENRKKIKEEQDAHIFTVAPGKVINPDATLSKTPLEAMTEHHSSVPAKNEICQSMKDQYQNLSLIKKEDKISLRFVNVHKKVDGQVYRTRFFYKDSSENEIPTFLLYREDDNDEPVLIETSPYKKGPQYLQTEKSLGEVLYTEEGVNIGVDQDLFLHYENKILKDLQGVKNIKGNKNFIECRF